MHKNRVALVGGAALAACLSACGGSDQGSAGPVVVTPGPTPTPAPSSSPTPTPSPATYTPYDALTGDQNFKTACALLDFQNLVPTVSPTLSYGRGPAIAFQNAPQTYTIGLDGKTLTFGPADLDASVPSPAKAYMNADKDRLTISRAGFDGTALQYARLGSISTTRSGHMNIYQCAFGVPTVVTDLPGATTISFPRLSIGASVYDFRSGTMANYTLNASTQSFVVDLSALRVDATIHMIGTGRPGTSNVDLGTFTGTATIDPATGRFDGTWSGTDRVIGSFSGAFFGPQGHEMGYAFGINRRDATGNLVFSAAGAIFGKY